MALTNQIETIAAKRKRACGVLHDTATAGETGVAIGFGIARLATRAGFGIASACIRAPAAAVETTVGPNRLSGGLRAANGVVGVARDLTHASQDAARGAAEGGLALTKGGLRHMGAEEGEVLRLALGGAAAEVLLSSAGLIRQFSGPLRDLPPGRLPILLLAWSRLQGAAEVGRPRVVDAGFGGAVVDADLGGAAFSEQTVRLMKYSAAAYGATMLRAGLAGAPLQSRRRVLEAQALGHDAGGQALAAAGLRSGVRLVAFEDVAEVYAPGYLLALDHELGAVVLAFRGTCSLCDALTDLACEPAEVALGGVHGIAHNGMLKAARRLGATLLPQVQAAVRELRWLRLAEPALLVTGHSLGAGVAALLTAVWSSENQFPGLSLRCVAFACPQVLDERLAAAQRSHTTSVIVSDDMVPRFSLASALELRSALLLLHAPDSEELPTALQAEALASQVERTRGAHIHGIVSRLAVVSSGHLCASGRLLHVSDGAHEVEHRSFRQILVSSDMTLAHMPWRYLAAVRSAVDN